MTLPDILTTNTQLKSAWFRLRMVIMVLLGLTGISRVAYVDKTGNNTTAKLGSITYKFLTVQAALNAISAAETATVGAGYGFTVLIGAGTYIENVVIPANVDKLTLRGYGVSTILHNTGAADTVSFTAAASSVDFLTIESMYVVNDQVNAALYAVKVDGNANATLFEEGALVLRDLIVYSVGSSCLYVRRAGAALISTCQFSSAGAGLTSLLNVASLSSYDSTLANVTVNWDNTAALPSPAKSSLKFFSTKTGDVSVLNQGSVYFDEACDSNDFTATVTDTATNVFGTLEHHGKIDNVSATFLFDTAGRSYFNFDRAAISGTFTAGQSAASTFRGAGQALNATFVGGQAITIGIRADVDLRYSRFLQADVVCTADADAGTLDRTMWTHTVAQGGGAGPLAVAFEDAATNPCAYPSATYTVVIESASLDGPFSITGKTTVDVDVTKTADGGTIEVTILRP